MVTFSSDSVTTEFITLPPPVDENRKQPLRRTILSFPVQNNESGLEQDLDAERNHWGETVSTDINPIDSLGLDESYFRRFLQNLKEKL